MVFRRRNRRTAGEWLRAALYPRGGWRRAGRYVWTRMTRLPDPPHRIARGIWAGVFVSFTPLFGFHLLLGAALAWVMRGNLLAALLATLVGNPLTFPLIAVVSVKTGYLLQGEGRRDPDAGPILESLGDVGERLWALLSSLVTDGASAADWSGLKPFWDRLLEPYLLGGALLGLVFATVAYHASLPVIAGIQRLRDRRRRSRAEAFRENAARRLRGGGNGPDGGSDGDRGG